MAIEMFDLGSVPENETPAAPDSDQSFLEAAAYKNQLERMFPLPKGNGSEAGFFDTTIGREYKGPVVGVYYDRQSSVVRSWVHRICIHVPVWWDDAALVELAIKREEERPGRLS